MSRAQAVTAPEYKLHDEGVFYEGVVRDIEDVDGLFGPQYKLILRFDDDTDADGNPRDTWHFVPQSYTTHEKNKLRIFYDGVFGRGEPVPLGEMVDPDDLIGKRFKAIFKHRKKKDGSPTDDIIIVKPAQQDEVSPF